MANLPSRFRILGKQAVLQVYMLFRTGKNLGNMYSI